MKKLRTSCHIMTENYNIRNSYQKILQKNKAEANYFHWYSRVICETYPFKTTFNASSLSTHFLLSLFLSSHLFTFQLLPWEASFGEIPSISHDSIKLNRFELKKIGKTKTPISPLLFSFSLKYLFNNFSLEMGFFFFLWHVH